MSNDRPTSPAPGTDIEVTPEMIEAAEHAVFSAHGQESIGPHEYGDYLMTPEFLTLIFKAMSKSLEASRTSPPETGQ
ncbi:MAG: hypothetical protein WDM86_02080 [Rhizomicrobium sp.]